MVFQQHNQKASLAHRVRTHVVKNAGPQNGDSTGDCEGQARIEFGENVAFDYLIDKYLFFCFFVYLIIGGTFESFYLVIVPFTCLIVVPLILVG